MLKLKNKNKKDLGRLRTIPGDPTAHTLGPARFFTGLEGLTIFDRMVLVIGSVCGKGFWKKI